jgi:hypothetical protein
MQAVRDLPEAERGKASERNRADMRASIRALLTPEQQTKYDALIAEQAGRSGTQSRGQVYVLEQGQLKALSLRLGISDGSSTEVLESSTSSLSAGSEVVVGLQPKPSKTATKSPF